MSELFQTIMATDPKRLFQAIVYPKAVVKPKEFIAEDPKFCWECSADLTDGGQHYLCCSQREG